MRFWDASAVVPLLLEQPTSRRAQAIAKEDPDVAVWWCTPVECASAIARRRREGAIASSDEAAALRDLERIRRHWYEILPVDQMRADALRIVRLHTLRAADAFQLAAAIRWAETPAGAEFVTFDQRLAASAELEGFRIVGIE